MTNIAHIPAALTAVMRENATRPDFAPEGSLALKPWFGSTRGSRCRRELDLPVVEAVAPYNEQIEALNRQIGAVLPRQSLKDASGASQMDAKTQVTSLHGVSMLDAAQYPLEANVALALLHEPGGENDRALVNVAVGVVRQPARHHGAGGGAGGARRRQCAERGAGRGGLPGRPAADGAGAPRGAGCWSSASPRRGCKDALDESFDFASVDPGR